MTFPVLASTVLSTATGTSLAVTMPASVAPGNLLLVACAANGRGWSTPAGWTLLAGSGTDNGWLFGRIADGTEGTSVTFSQTGTSATMGAIAARVTGNYNAMPEVAATIFTTNTSTPDPPALTPSWGSADTLWLAMVAVRDSRTVSAAPTNYSLDQAGSGTAPLTGLMSRSLTAASDNPGTMTLSGTSQGAVWTVGVRPAAAAAVNTSAFLQMF